MLYSQYREWAAKAYLARSECLTRMHQYKKALETLEEMLQNPDLKDRPELKDALKKIDTLKRQAT